MTDVSQAEVQSPDGAPVGTGSASTRTLGVLALVAAAGVTVLGLWLSPEDVIQHELVRMFYVHVPVAVFAFISCFATGLGSLFYLWKRSAWWDTVAYAGAEIGLVLTVLTLVTGSLWGRPAWGTYWEWDPRLTTTALLALLLVGYLALRRLPGSSGSQSVRAAVVGLLLVPQVIVVRQSVDWWRGLHQVATISLTPGGTSMENSHLFTFFASFVALGLVWLWLMIHRFRLAWLEREVAEIDLEQAIEDRRAEAGPPGSSADPRGGRP